MLSVLQGAAAAKRNKRQACGKQSLSLAYVPQLHRIRDLTATSPERQMQAASLLSRLVMGAEIRTAMKAERP